MKKNELVNNEWVLCTIEESDELLKRIPGLKPGKYNIMIDTRKKSIRVKDKDLKKEYKPIIVPRGKDALDILEGVRKSSKDEYRFNCSLQSGFDTVGKTKPNEKSDEASTSMKEEAKENGKWDKPPTAKEAIAVVELLRVRGKRFLPNTAHEDFDTAINELIGWLKGKSGPGLTPPGGGDIASKDFTHKGTKYRVDLKIGGKTAGESWFK